MAAKGLLDDQRAVPAGQAEDGFFSPLFRFDRAQGKRPLAGLDEAGRGPLAGPLVAAAVILPADFDSKEINDSKKLSEAGREKAFEIIASKALHCAWAVISPADVDRLNPLRASMTGMSECLSKLPVSPELALIDGDRIPAAACPCLAVVKGDSRSLAIAAASIVAKVIRDRLMIEEDARYPVYGFARHKGYGTKEHMKALAEHGPSPVHRLTFLGKRPEKPEKSPVLF